MKYALLIYTDQAAEAQRPQAETEAIYAQYGAYSDDVASRGIIRGGEALQGIATAKTVRVRNGEVISTDGPFAETKEQLGGFYLLDCATMEEALELAAKVPSSTFGSIEVRPVVVWE